MKLLQVGGNGEVGNGMDPVLLQREVLQGRKVGKRVLVWKIKKYNLFEIKPGVSICLDVVSIETLDLDTDKKLVSTIEKILTISKSFLDDRD